MRTLAIETTDFSGTVAALDCETLLAELPLDSKLRSAQTLAPAIETVLNQLRWKPGDVQLVAVATGPGSFTGLRVGVTTAKMFAYAVGAEVMGVNTLEAIATQSPNEFNEIWTAIDAQRNQVFSAKFILNAAGIRQWKTPGDEIGVDPARTGVLLLDDDAWLRQLPDGAAITGPVLAKLRHRIRSGITVVDPALWTPKAASVGLLAWRQFQSGQRFARRTSAPILSQQRKKNGHNLRNFRRAGAAHLQSNHNHL